MVNPAPLVSIETPDGREFWLGQQVRPYNRTDRSPAASGIVTRCIDCKLVEVFWTGDEFPRVEDVYYLRAVEIGGAR